MLIRLLEPVLCRPVPWHGVQCTGEFRQARHLATAVRRACHICIVSAKHMTWCDQQTDTENLHMHPLWSHPKPCGSQKRYVQMYRSPSLLEESSAVDNRSDYELQLTVLGARAIGSRTESVIALCRTMAEYKLAVDSSKKATELPLLRVCGTVQQNPHMRAFWASTISFFLAFLGRFVRIYYSSATLSLSS